MTEPALSASPQPAAVREVTEEMAIRALDEYWDGRTLTDEQWGPKQIGYMRAALEAALAPPEGK